ncbi:hypothetical protein J6590_019398 [Homalodisca vitripennis]|nr:hypothetical protein J6590_019398 [Homalodisca vitripennis]
MVTLVSTTSRDVQQRDSRTDKWEMDHYLTQFLTGHGNFKANLKRFNLVEEERCECGERETANHVLMECDCLRRKEETSVSRRFSSHRGGEMRGDVLLGQTQTRVSRRGLSGRSPKRRKKTRRQEAWQISHRLVLGVEVETRGFGLITSVHFTIKKRTN